MNSKKKYVVACYETGPLTELSDEIRHNIRTFIDAINENKQVEKDGGSIILKPGESVNLLVLAGIDTIDGFNQKGFEKVFSNEDYGFGIFAGVTAANIAASKVPDLAFRAGPASEAHRNYATIFASQENGYTADEVESLIVVIYVGDPNQQAIFENNSTDQTYAVRFEYTTTQDDGKDLPRTVRVVISQSDNDSSGKGQ